MDQRDVRRWQSTWISQEEPEVKWAEVGRQSNQTYLQSHRNIWILTSFAHHTHSLSALLTFPGVKYFINRNATKITKENDFALIYSVNAQPMVSPLYKRPGLKSVFLEWLSPCAMTCNVDQVNWNPKGWCVGCSTALSFDESVAQKKVGESTFSPCSLNNHLALRIDLPPPGWRLVEDLDTGLHSKRPYQIAV